MFLALAVAGLIPSACTSDFGSDLRLDGDVAIAAMSLDGYEGTIDLAKRTVKVAVPADYDVTRMKVTDLQFNDAQAKASLAMGDELNCEQPVTVRVTCGDVYLDYTLTVVRDDARILTFKLNGLYAGRIDQANGTIAVTVPDTADLTQMQVSLTSSEGATVTPADGSVVDFTNPVTFTAVYNTAKKEYVVTVKVASGASAAFVGTAATVDQLTNLEERTAAQWMLENVPMSEYISFADVASGAVNLNGYKVVWWHFHADNGDNPPLPADALNAVSAFKTYYENGGNLLLSRYATFYIANLGIAKDERVPNNSWGGYEASPEITSNPWNFFITSGYEDHAIFQNLLMKDGEPLNVYTCDTGYGITNSTAQWHIGSDWGGYSTLSEWRSLTGGLDLAHGGDGAVVIAEFEPRSNSGRVICIGSGCYDWYSSAVDAFSDTYHFNVEQLTLNAIDYLSE